jgi:hypothetical protein
MGVSRSMGCGFSCTRLSLTSPPTRQALFQVLSVTSLSTHSHGFLPYSHLDSHLHIIIEAEVWTGNHWIETFVMIDSGCLANVIDSRFAAALNIPSTHKSRAVKYTMADSKTSAGGMVTRDFRLQDFISSPLNANSTSTVSFLCRLYHT